MKVHLFSTGSIRAPGWVLRHLGDHVFPIVCALVEHPSQGLTLIDAGFGWTQVLRGRSLPDRLGSIFAAAELRPELIAQRRIAELGHDPRDVRRIVTTHLHWDHADGLADFPDAEIVVHEQEKSHACGLITPMGYDRFQYFDVERWRPVRFQRRGRLGFARTVDLFGDDSLVLVELLGHSPGHMGVLLPHTDPPLLFSGDAFFELDELKRGRIRPYQLLNSSDRRARQDSLRSIGIAQHLEPALELVGAHTWIPAAGWERTGIVRIA